MPYTCGRCLARCAPHNLNKAIGIVACFAISQPRRLHGIDDAECGRCKAVPFPSDTRNNRPSSSHRIAPKAVRSTCNIIENRYQCGRATQRSPIGLRKRLSQPDTDTERVLFNTHCKRSARSVHIHMRYKPSALRPFYASCVNQIKYEHTRARQSNAR